MSKNKGARGEREWAAYLKEHGYKAERGRQYSGGPDSPDVVCAALPFHWEVKRVERLIISAAVEQAIGDCPEGKTPVVAHRKNNHPWLITLTADDFFKLIKS